jgi:Ca2+-binding RTX toxin-like protein
LKIAKTARASLNLESLEKRDVPTAFLSNNGDIVVNCGGGNDTVTVHQQQGWYRVVENNTTVWFAAGQVSSGYVRVNCGGGNDYVNNYASSLRLIANGQWGNDTLIGDAQPDHLNGGEGNDTLMGHGGSDYLEGRKGYDRLFGMGGNDTLDGGDDGVADYLNGGSGRDYFQRDMLIGRLGFRNRDYPTDFSFANDRFYG